MVSLAALRWLTDQDAFVMLDRDGSVLATTGPVSSSDAKLRRAQALANQSGAALRITRELISQKILFGVKRNSAAASAESLEVGRAPDADAQTSKHGTIHNLASAVIRSGGLCKQQNHANAYPVTIAGRSFFRSDLRGDEKALSLLRLGIGVTLWSHRHPTDSPRDLEDPANIVWRRRANC